jgi:hypothetical protein
MSAANSKPAPRRIVWGRVIHQGKSVMIAADALTDKGIESGVHVDGAARFLDLANLSLSYTEAHQVCVLTSEFSKKAYKDGFRMSIFDIGE